MPMRIASAPFGATTAVILALALLSACGADSHNQSDGSDPARSGNGLTAEELAVEPPSAGTGLDEQRGVASERDSDAVTALDWDALIPEEWRPERLLAGLSDDGASLDDIDDEDPRADLVMDKLKALWKEAPIVEALDGQRVKLPGFVVPLGLYDGDMHEFLLVPYYGACIHVPPPPANQTVYVVLTDGMSYRGGLFDTVWVTGLLRVERFSSQMADAGYRLEARAIAPYQ